MALKLFQAMPRASGKTQLAITLAKTVPNASLVLLPTRIKIAGLSGPFIIDEISKQHESFQHWVLMSLTRHDFYLFCDLSDVNNIYPPLKRYIEANFPEYFI